LKTKRRKCVGEGAEGKGGKSESEKRKGRGVSRKRIRKEHKEQRKYQWGQTKT
jgi:hypothetical protein